MSKEITCIDCKYLLLCPVNYSYNNAACLTIRKERGYSKDEMIEKLERVLTSLEEALEKYENE